MLGYFNYGGIHRAVALEILDGPALDEVQVEAVPDALGGLLRVQCMVRHPQPGLRLSAACAGSSTDEPVPVDGRFATELLVPGAEPVVAGQARSVRRRTRAV